jgi:hypothetical protein
MATYQPTTKVGSNAEYVGGGVNSVGAIWDIPSITLGTADVLAGPTLPKNARVLAVTLFANDCDTGTSLTLDVGDSADDNRLITGATIGQAGGVSTALVVTTGMNWKTTAATRIDVTPQAASAGSASTTQMVGLKIDYIIEEELA